MRLHYSIESYPRTTTPNQLLQLANRQDIQEQLKRKDGEMVSEPFVNISEQDNYCKIEAALPGFNREDFFITIDRNILSLSVLAKKRIPVTGEKFQLHEFRLDSFTRHVILPENVETDFVRAEYKEGILTMYLLKTDHPSGSAAIEVMVY